MKRSDLLCIPLLPAITDQLTQSSDRIRLPVLDPPVLFRPVALVRGRQVVLDGWHCVAGCSCFLMPNFCLLMRSSGPVFFRSIPSVNLLAAAWIPIRASSSSLIAPASGQLLSTPPSSSVGSQKRSSPPHRTPDPFRPSYCRVSRAMKVRSIVQSAIHSSPTPGAQQYRSGWTPTPRVDRQKRIWR